MSLQPTPAHVAALARQNFSFFCRGAFHTLLPSTEVLWNWHLDLIAERLEDVRSGKTRRLIINIPPRYGKSLIASVAFPAFILGRDPTAQIVCVSYSQDLSEKMARDTRRLMNSPWCANVFASRLDNPRARLAELTTGEGGCRLATSVTGTITGRGGNIIIIDDPLKPIEAASEVQRKAVNVWFDNTVPTRNNDKENGAIIIIMQRLHEDDLVGHLLEQGHWDVLSLPAIAEADEEFQISGVVGPRVIRRREGEALHPERETLASIERLKSEMGTYAFAAQYQQRPAPAGGGHVKIEWFRSYDPDHHAPFTQKIQSWDTASTIGQMSDYSVCTTWGMAANDEVFLIDVFRRKLEYPDLKRKVRELAALHNATTVLIEDAASGIQLIQELRQEGFARIEAIKVTINKKMRMVAQTARIEAGKVRIPATAHWRDTYLDEMAMFSNGRNDDQVDSTSQALAWMQSANGPARWLATAKELLDEEPHCRSLPHAVEYDAAWAHGGVR